MAPTDSELNLWLKAAVNVAKKAGVMIKNGFDKVKTVEMKDNPRDLVTETDKSVEAMVLESLGKEFPDHRFVGEESVAAGAKCQLTSDPTWFIDPVDGTMNFVHRFPFSCISIGLYVDKQPAVAVIYNPMLEQLYTASKGHGAFLNNQPLKVSSTKELSQALVMTELWCRPDEKKMEIILSNALKVIKKSHGPRCMGSAALNMCMVAQGGADAYYEIGVHAWDMAAGRLLVEEAGGVVLDMNGDEHNILNRRLLCSSSKELAAEIIALLRVYDEVYD